MGVESFAHRAAKELFASWLRELANEQTAKGRDTPRFGNYLWWRVNRPGPHFGVWTEYPIMPVFGTTDCREPSNPGRVGINPVWDEQDDKWEARPPSFDECIASGHIPEFVADIAIQHKGYIKTIVEIVHKHPPHDDKVVGYFNIGVNFLVLPSAWVLGQVARPTSTPDQFWFWEPT